MGKAAVLILLVFGLFSVHTDSYAAETEFYKDKLIRVVVGTVPGGGLDTYSRAVARHMGKHIAGSPKIMVENMPGAGTITAANHIYNRAKPDGLTIGLFIGGLVLQQVMGQKGMEFDGRKFEWLGTPLVLTPTCVLTKASEITSLDQWFSAKEPVKLGGITPGATTDDMPRILKEAINLPARVIDGYKGTSEIRIAAEIGEIAGGCWNWETLKVHWGQALQTGQVKVILQALPKRHPELKDIPNAIDYAKTKEARQLIEVGIHDLNAIQFAYSLPPGTPTDKVQLLRRAFMQTMKNPEFLAESEKARLDIDPLSGEQVAKIMAGFYQLDPGLVAKLRRIIFP
jgi:tripartite-type tricarboxylate transporter receptor subunit TctC